MKRWVLIALALAGCDKLFDIDALDQPGRDGGGDGSGSGDGKRVDTPAGCYGQGLLTLCDPPIPVPGRVISGGVNLIDTSNDPRCWLVTQGPGEPQLCVVTADTFVIQNAHVIGAGPNPLVLLATTQLTIDVSSIVDVSSVRASGRRGAGSRTDCTPAIGAIQMSSNGGASGGAGGSYSGRGGAGGWNDLGLGPISEPAIPRVSIMTIRGGCAGSHGGPHQNNGTGGAGGEGGGALYLLVGQTLTISGYVLANGASGSGGPAATDDEHTGGGGGGAGGLIVLDAPSILATNPSRAILAHGGGGGAGADGQNKGNDGSEIQSGNPSLTAAGGPSSSDEGAGGSSSGATVLVGGPGSAASTMQGGGGGGGGGGAGYILTYGAVTSGAQIYPSPIQP